jgi:hypothetical protein
MPPQRIPLHRSSSLLQATTRKLSEIASFTQSVAEISADLTLAAHAKQMAVFRLVEDARFRLWLKGELTPLVEEELLRVAEAAAAGYTRQVGEIGSALEGLLLKYRPADETRPEKLRCWWKTTVVPWWQDDRW